MIASILIVCVGNICRSPTAAKILGHSLQNVNVESAGLGAMVGSNANEISHEIATNNGFNLDGHVARQLDTTIAAKFDLILTLELEHQKYVFDIAPEARGKTMLLGHWMDQKDIPDPYGKSIEFHESVYDQISKACNAWVIRLRST
ncbi:low molecular weight phosphotyrosine protein phosphatase [Amylibacter sp.]|nr:low molecular weight phosphotyrosine protein phosphatase [Amylibacter sp.]